MEIAKHIQSKQNPSSWIFVLLLMLSVCAIHSLSAQQPQDSKPYLLSSSGGAQLNYTHILNGNVLPCNGLNFVFHGGLTLERRNTMYLGIVLSLRGSFYGTNRDFGLINENLQPYYVSNPSSPIDSEYIALINYNFNSPRHSNEPPIILTYGLVFSPSYRRWGCPQFQIRRGGQHFYPDIDAYNPYVYNHEEYVMMSVPINYYLQFSFKPLNFFKPKAKTGFWWGDLLSVAIYHDRISLRRSKFDFQPMNRFLTPAFFDKYSFAHHTGFMIGLGLN